MRSGACLAAAAALAVAGGCVRVERRDGPDGGPPPPSTARHAQLLAVLDLNRASANLIGSYLTILGELSAHLGENGVVVDQAAVLAQYGGIAGVPALVWGTTDVAGSSTQADAVLRAATISGRYDAPVVSSSAEEYNLATVARRLDTATLPPGQTGGGSRPFFSPPEDLFIVLVVHPTRRLCTPGAPGCAIGGVAPADLFSSTRGDGTAAWLKLPQGAYPAGRVVQAFITTSEGESEDAFYARCSAVANFPLLLLDDLEPSPVSYYVELANLLRARGILAETLDLCDALGSEGDLLIKDLAQTIVAATAG